MAAKALGVIPARYASTRFPGKPLLKVAGKALLQRVWEQCARARELARLVIATDDRRIVRAAESWGAEVRLTSKSHASGTDRAAEVARKLNRFGLIINIQGDEPLIDPRLIDRLVVALRNRNTKMVTAAHPFTSAADIMSPHQVKVVTDRSGHALYFSRSPIPFPRNARTGYRTLRHQGIYGFSRATLLQFVKWKPSSLERTEELEQLRALENGVTLHVLVTKHGSPGVDTPEDAAALEKFLARAQRGGVSR